MKVREAESDASMPASFASRRRDVPAAVLIGVDRRFADQQPRDRRAAIGADGQHSAVRNFPLDHGAVGAAISTCDARRIACFVFRFHRCVLSVLVQL
jgi:hypothetical protein